MRLRVIMNSRVQSIVVLVLSIAISSVVEARGQRCKDSKTATTPTSDFVINSNGTAVHKKTGLMWKRCIEGLSGADCQGKPKKLFWQDMVEEYKSPRFAGMRGWRVPTVDELKSIIEKKCKGPALNLEIFPDASKLPNWTSSEVEGGDKVWQMYITSGVAIKASKAAASALRLVRTP